MKRYRIYILLLILTISFTHIIIMTRDAGGSPKRMPKREDRISEIKKEIISEKERLKRAEQQERVLLKKIDSLERQIYRTEEEIARLTRRLVELEKEIKTLELELAGLNRYLAEHQKRLSDRLRVMYGARHLGYLETLLTATDFASFIKRTHFMRLIAIQDAKLIQEVKEGIETISQRKDELRVKYEEVNRLKRTAEAAKKLRTSQRHDRKVLLARVREQKSVHLARIKELEEASRRIKQMITRFEEKKGVTPSLTPELLRLKNHLIWPIEGGRVVLNFGPYQHPKYGTKAINKGIDIEAPYGQIVRSVLDGKVVFADYFKGYGRLTMVDHGHGLYSLYAHLAQILVENGQMVKQGSVIGKVGDTGPIGEAGLHFELRINGEPVDPLEWLNRR